MRVPQYTIGQLSTWPPFVYHWVGNAKAEFKAISITLQHRCNSTRQDLIRADLCIYRMSSRQDVEMSPIPVIPQNNPAARPKPWRDEGYPAFSRWMSSSEDFLVLRRFDQLNTRALLLMQDRIARLEENLLRIDATARQSPDELADSSSLHDDPQTERVAILKSLTSELQTYNMPDFLFSLYSWHMMETDEHRRIPRYVFSGQELEICAEVPY